MKIIPPSSSFLLVGNAPFLPEGIIKEFVKDKVIVALDGACDKLIQMGISPDVILGDFDSVQNKEYWGIKKTFAEMAEELEIYSGNHGVLIAANKNQNLTDLAKGIAFCDRYQPSSIEIICAISDTRMDLTLSNIGVLRAQYKKNRPLYLHTQSQTLRFVTDETIEINGKPNDYCGIFSFSECTFSSQGLKYEGNNSLLKFGLADSVSNRLKDIKAKITIKGEALVIQPGRYSSDSSSSSTSSKTSSREVPFK